MPNQTKDVIIAGGGLAGLSLASQLKSASPDLDILVLERNTFPVPEITAKVGESTVEIGSHYLSDTIGLKNHLNEQHLRKHGLRCYFGQTNDDFSKQDELGVSELFGLPTYQIDRGVIENHLFEKATNQGVTVLDGVTTQAIESSPGKQSVQLSTKNQGDKTYDSRWLVDAAGRQALLKNKLKLHKPSEHKGNAVWFRIDRRIQLDDWSNNSDWRARVKDSGTRWLSTNHLMGPGYWVWIIPLSTGATSIGIVMDDHAFADSNIGNITDALRWLEKEQTHCARAIEGAKVLDFVIIQDYSYDCKQMFSDEGWGLTGESGVFADPFYSPGSDFIAFNNTFISDLICKSKHGEDIRLDSRVFQSIGNSFYKNTLSIYTHQYGGFGDRRMMAVKLLWDYSYYWGVLSILFFKDMMTDIKLMRELSTDLSRAQEANKKVQQCFRERAMKRIMLEPQGIFFDQYLIPCLKHFNEVLKDPSKIDSHIVLRENIDMLEKIGLYATQMLEDNASTTITNDERDLLGDYRLSVLA